MNTTAPFTLDLLGNFEALKQRYFTGDKELEALAKQSIDKSLYMDRWKVVWILVSFPFKFISAVVISAFKSLLDCSCLSEAVKLDVEDTYLFGFEDLNRLFYSIYWGSQFKLPSINEYQIQDSDIYKLKPIPKSEIPDPKIRENLHPEIKKASFSSRVGKGLCHGGVSWFNYLFLKGLNRSKLADQCESYTEYGERIASLFVNGQPKQAGLIQSLYGIEKVLFPIEKKPYSIFTRDEFKGLPDGVYYVNIGKHAISYVKAKKEQFVWDPDVGFIEIKKPEDVVSFNGEKGILFELQILEKPSFISQACAFLGIR